MSKKTNNCILVDFDNLNQATLNFENVNHCPICHTGISPEVRCSIAFRMFTDYYDSKIALINQCPSCNAFFIVFYNSNFNKEMLSLTATLDNVSFISPNKFKSKSFTPNICDISKRFTKIYNQALQAESLGLDEISGMGFRKALEILVKDYIIYLYPDFSKFIKELSVGNCIKQYILDKEIKALAEKAVWLGNDQTHYVQFYTNYDVNFLKKLIDHIVSYINIKLVIAEAENIPHPSFAKNKS